MTGLLSDHKCYSGIFSVTSSESYLIEFFLHILTHVGLFLIEVWTLRLILFISQRIFLMLKTKTQCFCLGAVLGPLLVHQTKAFLVKQEVFSALDAAENIQFTVIQG